MANSQKQCCSELPLFLFSLCHMVELVHTREGKGEEWKESDGRWKQAKE